MSCVRFLLQIFTGEGDFLVEFGSQGSAPEEFERPADITVDAKGNIYVVDFGNNHIQKFAPLISQTKNEWKIISSTKWIWKPNFNSLLSALPTRFRGNCSSGYLNPDAPLQVMQQRFCSKTRRLLCVLFLWFSQVFRWTKLVVDRIKLRPFFNKSWNHCRIRKAKV